MKLYLVGRMKCGNVILELGTTTACTLEKRICEKAIVCGREGTCSHNVMETWYKCGVQISCSPLWSWFVNSLCTVREVCNAIVTELHMHPCSAILIINNLAVSTANPGRTLVQMWAELVCLTRAQPYCQVPYEQQGTDLTRFGCPYLCPCERGDSYLQGKAPG